MPLIRSSPMCNVAVVSGRLSSDPRSRLLPSGSTVVNLEIRVDHDGRAADSVPVACFDPPARTLDLTSGDEVLVVGSIRRRFFRAGGATASRTEVVATSVVKTTRKAQVRRLLAKITADLAALADLADCAAQGEPAAPGT